MEQMTFFGGSDALAALSQRGDPLQRLEQTIDFEAFRPELEKSLYKPAKGPGGAPRWDAVLMFKLLVLQRLYNLSDEQAEYQVSDRLSFRRFLGLSLCDAVPDSRTVWVFRETLVQAGTLERLFHAYRDQLLTAGLITREGSLVDASFVTVPKQRNTREENKQIKQGKVPEDWQGKTDRLAHKDLDARWTRKGPDTFYGYKNHVKVDRASKLIVAFKVTPASHNDGQQLPELVGVEDRVVHADCAYNRDLVREHLRSLGIRACLQMKGTRHVQLTEQQKQTNRWHAKTRVRVEHVFALIHNCIKGDHLRYIGQKRITAGIALVNLLHNILRVGQLRALAAQPA
jgi:IS5 family transposase